MEIEPEGVSWKLGKQGLIENRARRGFIGFRPKGVDGNRARGGFLGIRPEGVDGS
jgi:hypothetical protein